MQHQKVYQLQDCPEEILAQLGKKAFSLCELSQSGFPVLPGFIISDSACQSFLRSNGLEPLLKKNLTGNQTLASKSFTKNLSSLRKKIATYKLPENLTAEIINHYLKLDPQRREPSVTISVSIFKIRKPVNSLEEIVKSRHSTQGLANLIDYLRLAWSLQFNRQTLAAVGKHQVFSSRLKTVVLVQLKKIPRLKGNIFTSNPLLPDKKNMLIEVIRKGKQKLNSNSSKSISYLIEKNSGQLVNSAGNPRLKKGGNAVLPSLLGELRNLGVKIQNHYLQQKKIRWMISQEGKLYILGIGNLTRAVDKSNAKNSVRLGSELRKNLKLVVKGEPASPGIAQGKIRTVSSAKDLNKVGKGDILLITKPGLNLTSSLKKASALIVENGSLTMDSAITARDLGIACVIQAQNSGRLLKNSQQVTVNGASGEVFSGSPAPFKIAPVLKRFSRHLSAVEEKTATQLFIDLLNPSQSDPASRLPSSGVGLLRSESILKNIGIHPKQIITDGKQKEYTRKFTDILSAVCKNFYPRPVLYRPLLLPSNQYRKLKGGKIYEPYELNPILGYWGAQRYLSEEACLELELQALKNIRNKNNLKNLWLLLPLLRGAKELLAIKRLAAAYNLTRSNSFKLFISLDVPANILELESYLDIGIDGISLNLNSLSALLYGINPKNQELNSARYHLQPGIFWLIEKALKTAKKHGAFTSAFSENGIFPSDTLEKLVSNGIRSITVQPELFSQIRGIIHYSELKSVLKTNQSL